MPVLGLSSARGDDAGGAGQRDAWVRHFATTSGAGNFQRPKERWWAGGEARVGQAKQRTRRGRRTKTLRTRPTTAAAVVGSPPANRGNLT